MRRVYVVHGVLCFVLYAEWHVHFPEFPGNMKFIIVYYFQEKEEQEKLVDEQIAKYKELIIQEHLRHQKILEGIPETIGTPDQLDKTVEKPLEAVKPTSVTRPIASRVDVTPEVIDRPVCKPHHAPHSTAHHT